MTFRAVAATARATLKQQVVNPFAYLNIVIYPAIVTTIALVLLGGSGRFAYAVIGGGLTGLWSVTLIDGGSGINSERWSGTLEQVIASPAGLPAIVVGKLVSAMFMGLLAFVVSLGLALLWLHRLPGAARPGEFAVAAVLTVFSFFALGMLLAPLFALRRGIFAIANSLEQLVYILAGFMFPLSVLPGWVQPFTWVLAPAWSVRALFSSAGAEPAGGFAAHCAAALALSLVYIAAARPLYALVDFRARVTGQMALA